MSSKVRSTGVQKKSPVGAIPPAANAAHNAALATANANPAVLKAVVQGNALKVDYK